MSFVDGRSGPERRAMIGVGAAWFACVETNGFPGHHIQENQLRLFTTDVTICENVWFGYMADWAWERGGGGGGEIVTLV